LKVSPTHKIHGTGTSDTNILKAPRKKAALVYSKQSLQTYPIVYKKKFSELGGTLPSKVEVPKANLFYLLSSTAELTKLPPPVQFHFQVVWHKSHEGWLQILLMSCLPHLATAKSKQVSAQGSDHIATLVGLLLCSFGVIIVLCFVDSFYSRQKEIKRSYARKGPGGRCPRDPPFHLPPPHI